MKTVEDLKAAMQEGVVEFSFMKKDGTIRVANGTTKLELIPEENHPVMDSPTRKKNDEQVCYYDVDKDAWRSFVCDSFIE
jgi:hypothetical protein